MINLMKAFSTSLRKLIQMTEKFPMTFEIVDAKIAEPNLSYSELAERFSCRKQNVQYHLKKAVRMFPELSFALIVDSRFLGSNQALKHYGRAQMKFR